MDIQDKTMMKLLKSVKCDDERTRKLKATIHQNYETSKQFSTTAPRPVVSLPVASNFNKVMTMDLKEVRVDTCRYILNMIDTFTRFTVAVFIQDKKASTIVHNVMLH